MIVKEAIDPSGSVPPNPGTRTLLLGGMLKLAFVVTGGWLGVGVGVRIGVGAGVEIGIGVGAGVGVGVGIGAGVGVGVGMGDGIAAIVAGAGLLSPWLSVAL